MVPTWQVKKLSPFTRLRCTGLSLANSSIYHSLPSITKMTLNCSFFALSDLRKLTQWNHALTSPKEKSSLWSSKHTIILTRPYPESRDICSAIVPSKRWALSLWICIRIWFRSMMWNLWKRSRMHTWISICGMRLISDSCSLIGLSHRMWSRHPYSRTSTARASITWRIFGRLARIRVLCCCRQNLTKFTRKLTTRCWIDFWD